MPKILITADIASEGVDRLLAESDFDVDIKVRPTDEELIEMIPQYDCIITRSDTAVQKNVIDAATNLKIIARAAVGVANIDVDYATEKGLLVVNAPAANTNSAAEHSMALLLAVMRQLHSAHQDLSSGVWDRHKFMGKELLNKTIGIIGIGNVGHRMAHMANGFNMRVLAYDPYVTDRRFEEHRSEKVDLETLLKESDIISLHVPRNKETIGMIGEKEFAHMKDGVVIINAARGGIVEEGALYDALKSGKVWGAGIDTWNEEPDTTNKLQKLPNVVCSPHIGACTFEAQTRIGETIADQVIKGLKSEAVDHPVNLPNTGKLSTVIQSYAKLAERLGSLATQYTHQIPDKVEIWYRGRLLKEKNIHFIRLAFLQGLLKSTTDKYLSFVNIEKYAEGKNIDIKRIDDEEFSVFESAIKMQLHINGEIFSFGGTVYNETFLRITKMNDYYFEMEPKGRLLIVQNYDKPGAIAHIGAILSQHKINIATFQLTPDAKRETAMAIINVDSEINDSVRQELLNCDTIVSVKEVVL